MRITNPAACGVLRRTIHCGVVLGATLLALLSQFALGPAIGRAANTTNNYTGSTTGNVTTGSNWSLTLVPTVAEDAVFPVGALTGIRNFGGGATPGPNPTWGSLNDLSTGTTISLRNDTTSTSTVTLTLGGGGNLGNGVSGTAADLLYVATGGTMNITGVNGTNVLNLALGQSGNFNIAGTGASTISSVISGTGFGITKMGAGSLTFSAANTYTGATVVSQGTLNLGAQATGSTSFTIGDANSGVTNPTLAMNVAQTYNALTVGSSATGAKLLFNPTGTNSYQFNGNITLNSTLTIQKSNQGGNWANFQPNATSLITGSGVAAGSDALVLDNLGGAQTYWTNNTSAANNFTGNVRFKGVWQIQSNSASSNRIIPDASMVTIDGGGSIAWTTSAFTETIDGLAGAGAVINNNNGSAALTINANNSANNGNRVFTGTLGSTGASSVTLGGTGTQELSGVNVTYAGATFLNNGTLKLTNATGWNSNITIGGSNSPTLQLNAPASGDNWTFNKSVTGGSANATVEKVGAGTVNLPSLSHTGNLLVTAGTLNVTQAEAYTGSTTIDSGTLRLAYNAPATLPAGPAANLQVQLDANTLSNGAITSWTNAAPAGNFTGTGTVQSGGAAFNNNKVVHFNGTTDILTNAGVGYANQSIFYIGAVDGTDNQRLVGGTAGNNWLMGFWGGNQDTAFDGAFFGAAVAANTSTKLYEMTRTSGNALTLYSNGTSLGTGTGAQLVSMSLGGSFGENSAGSLGEVLVYNSVLSTPDRQAVEAYLRYKWFGNGNLPTATTVNFTGAGTLDLNNVNQTIASLSSAISGSQVTLGTGTLTTGNSTSTTFAGSISGGGGLTKQGAGTFTLTGSNSYGGTTTINNGTLEIGNGGTTGTLGAGNVTNDAALVFNRSNSYLVSNVISGTGSVSQNGTGTTTLAATNLYSGTTSVTNGTLSVTGSLANNGSNKVFITATDDTLLGNPLLNRAITAGANAYAGFGSTETGVGGLGSTVDILAGTASANTTLGMQWRLRLATEKTTPEGGTPGSPPLPFASHNGLVSDVVDLNGLGSDLYALQMTYDPTKVIGSEANLLATKSLYLGSFDTGTGKWENAVLNNTGNNATLAQQGYSGSFASFQAFYGTTLSSYIGAWGVDIGSGKAAWAVVNHNSEFAVVPEPGTFALMLFGGVFLWFMRKRS